MGAAMDIKGRSLRYSEDEEHILRRLGGAVIVLWDTLPVEIQRALFDQAVLMVDRYQTVQLKEQIARFIHERNKHGAGGN